MDQCEVKALLSHYVEGDPVLKKLQNHKKKIKNHNKHSCSICWHNLPGTLDRLKCSHHWATGTFKLLVEVLGTNCTQYFWSKSGVR